MAINIKSIAGKLKAHYDRMLAFIVLALLLLSLIHLAIRIGTMRSKEQEFLGELDRIGEINNPAQPEDLDAYEEAMAAIARPAQLNFKTWTQAMFVPERRVSCVDCVMPIPYAAERCPHLGCGAEQPPLGGGPEPIVVDRDKDGMLDDWERANGLNPLDPTDAEGDLDKDGYTNLDEFVADPQTNPQDPKDFPHPDLLFQLVKVEADLFNLRFKSVITLPGGNLNFQLNLRGNNKTYFARMDETVEGFTLIGYEEKSEERQVEGFAKPRKVDISELTLKRGDKTIVLVKGREEDYSEHRAELTYTLDGSMRTLTPGDVFEVKGRNYTVMVIDSRPEKVVLKRDSDGKELEIVKAAAPVETARPSPVVQQKPEVPATGTAAPDAAAQFNAILKR